MCIKCKERILEYGLGDYDNVYLSSPPTIKDKRCLCNSFTSDNDILIVKKSDIEPWLSICEKCYKFVFVDNSLR